MITVHVFTLHIKDYCTLHTPSLNSVNYYHPRCGNIPLSLQPRGILPTPNIRFSMGSVQELFYYIE